MKTANPCRKNYRPEIDPYLSLKDTDRNPCITFKTLRSRAIFFASVEWSDVALILWLFPTFVGGVVDRTIFLLRKPIPPLIEAEIRFYPLGLLHNFRQLGWPLLVNRQQNIE